MPLDGKSKSKGKTLLCGLKKAKLYDETKNTMKKDKIAEVVCGILTQTDVKTTCKTKLQACIKGKVSIYNNFATMHICGVQQVRFPNLDKGLFKDPKKDTEYKSWSQPFECFEKWVSGVSWFD